MSELPIYRMVHTRNGMGQLLIIRYALVHTDIMVRCLQHHSPFAQPPPHGLHEVVLVPGGILCAEVSSMPCWSTMYKFDQNRASSQHSSSGRRRGEGEEVLLTSSPYCCHFPLQRQMVLKRAAYEGLRRAHAHYTLHTQAAKALGTQHGTLDLAIHHQECGAASDGKT